MNLRRYLDLAKFVSPIAIKSINGSAILYYGYASDLVKMGSTLLDAIVAYTCARDGVFVICVR